MTYLRIEKWVFKVEKVKQRKWKFVNASSYLSMYEPSFCIKHDLKWAVVAFQRRLISIVGVTSVTRLSDLLSFGWLLQGHGD